MARPERKIYPDTRIMYSVAIDDGDRKWAFAYPGPERPEGDVHLAMGELQGLMEFHGGKYGPPGYDIIAMFDHKPSALEQCEALKSYLDA